MNASVSYRIAPDLWLEAGRFAELLDALVRHPGCCDEVALFSSFIHSVPALPELQRRACTMSDRFAALRRAGFRAGVNVLTTIGHHAEDLTSAATGFTALTGIDGVAEPGTCCPNDPDFLEHYLRPAFLALAAAEPDFIWLDDDIRFHGHGRVGLVCFCDRCLAEFNRRIGREFSRASLHEGFQSGAETDRRMLRRAWLEFSGESVRKLFVRIEAIVHAAAPQIELGAMDAAKRTGDLADFASLAAALAGVPPRPVRWRPGGGAYTDYRLQEEVVRGKAMQLGAECALLPDSVTAVQAEIESFNYQRLRKSLRATALEAAAYVASGAGGVAWNILDGSGDFVENLPVIAETARIRPFLDALAAANGRARPVGVWNGWTPQAALLGRTDGADWCAANGPGGDDPHGTELFAAGIPAAYRLEEAEVTMLIGRTAEWLSDAELRAVFARGVYCDVATLGILERRGLARWAGFRAVRRFEADALERQLEHALNPRPGFTRDGRLSFARWFGDEGGAWALEHPDGRGAALAELVNYRGETVASCCLGIYENELGGRVATAGYFPTANLLFSAKLVQIKRLFDWLSGDRLSGWTRSYASSTLWVRREADSGRMTAACLNPSCDDQNDVEVALRTPRREGMLTDMTGARRPLTGREEVSGVTVFTLPALGAWRAALLEV